MSGSLTVIGGHSASQGLTGIVTIPSGFTGSVLTSLQSLLVSASNAVASNTANFDNLDVAGQIGAQNASVGSFGRGVLVVSNTNSVNAVTAGSANISLNVPTGYNTLAVQAPGSETISGNGASNFLGVFGANSSVNFVTDGGSGSIFAGGPDNAVLLGSNWTFNGSPDGGETVAALANNSFLAVAGAGTGPESNLVSADAANVSIVSGGASDLDVVYGGTAQISVSGSGDVLVDGGAATVNAVAGVGSVAAAFAYNGGQIYFINSSNTAVSVLGGFAGAVGGNLTVFGGAGGGYFQGGPGGNNSLTGGSGSVTLIGNGDRNTLVGGTGASNDLVAASGSTTMIGVAGSTSNQFTGGTGSLVVSTSGSGAQSFFVGMSGQEIISGSTVSGAVNSYFFLQDSTAGGSDIIENFRVGTDHVYINPFGNATTLGVTIAQVDPIAASASHPSGGSLVLLSNNTTIEFLGVSSTSLQSDIGSTTV